jgi:hypothetical protein
MYLLFLSCHTLWHFVNNLPERCHWVFRSSSTGRHVSSYCEVLSWEGRLLPPSTMIPYHLQHHVLPQDGDTVEMVVYGTEVVCSLPSQHFMRLIAAQYLEVGYRLCVTSGYKHALCVSLVLYVLLYVSIAISPLTFVQLHTPEYTNISFRSNKMN